MTQAIGAVQLIRQPASAVMPVARVQAPPGSVAPAQVPSRPAAPSASMGLAELDCFLGHMVKLDASDLYVTADSPPVFRVNGEGLKARQPLTATQVEDLIASFLSPAQRE